MSWYVDVILPLPLGGSFTYRLPQEYADTIQTGSRVVVQFGARRYYTALVLHKHTDAPQGNYDIKDVVEVLDTTPIVQPMQLKLWQWIADYYMCALGDVYKAALPSGLKLESETVVTLNDDFIAEAPLRDREQKILDSLSANPKQRVQQLLKNCGLRSGMQAIKSLIEKSAIKIDETLRQSYKPRCEVYVRLSDAYRSEATLNEALLSLKRAMKQQQLLLRLIELAECEEPCHTHKEVSRSTLLKTSGMSPAVLNALIAKGIVETYLVETGRLTTAAATGSCQLSPLSPHQQRAFDDIKEGWRHHDVCLLHGVTASGKTEVYTHLINEQLQQGRQVLFLVPEIALTQQMTDRLRRSFGSRLGVYHSRFSDAERVEVWKKQLSSAQKPVLMHGISQCSVCV